MAKLILKQCKCGKTFNIQDIGVSENLCSTCNSKIKSEIKRKDALRKNLNRDDKVSSNLERLGGIEK